MNWIDLYARVLGETVYVEIVRLCKEWKAANLEEAIQHAASEGRIEIVDLCKELGATDFNGAMWVAASEGHVEIIKLCEKWGATNFDDAMWIAQSMEEVTSKPSSYAKVGEQQILAKSWL